MGFIRFGSRIDLFLPLDAKISVKLGEKTTGGETVIARFD
jgi:phosphatidylserine decarboxylase